MFARAHGFALARVAVIAAVVQAGCERAPIAIDDTVPTIDAAPPRDLEIVAARRLGDATLTLRRDREGLGSLWLASADASERFVPCDRLVGAWGLWVDDVDGDGFHEAIVALKKPARFDTAIENRLHVYGFEQGRCVPAWRGTRLAGRFDALATDAARPGTIVVAERLSRQRRRVARYRWTGFGYAVADVLWEGVGAIPPDLTRDLVAPS